MYSTWTPFVFRLKKLAVLGKLDQVGWFEVSPPFSFELVRDSCYTAIGCDSMMESGEVIAVAPGLEDGDNKGSEESFVNNFLAREALIKDTIEMPPRPKGFNKKRMQLNFLKQSSKWFLQPLPIPYSLRT